MLLPIAPFTETSGTFVNAEGRVQSFHAVVKPLGETRPAWKVLRVLANLLGLPGFDFESSQDVLASSRRRAHGAGAGERLDNATQRGHRRWLPRRATPVVASHLPARRPGAPRTVAAADGRCAALCSVEGVAA